MEIQFDDLEQADLMVDCIYKGGKESTCLRNLSTN